MFGLVGALIGYLTYQQGLRTDVASATGSLHAKVADIKANLGVKSVQRGTVNFPTSGEGSPVTANISAVNVDKSVVLYGGVSIADSTATPDEYMGRVVLTNSTTVTAYRGGLGEALSLSWQVIEFY